MFNWLRRIFEKRVDDQEKIYSILSVINDSEKRQTLNMEQDMEKKTSAVSVPTNISVTDDDILIFNDGIINSLNIDPVVRMNSDFSGEGILANCDEVETSHSLFDCSLIDNNL